MERWVTIVLMLLVLLVGLLVVQRISNGQKEVPKAIDGIECKFKGGSCADPCLGEVVIADCGEGSQCCVADP